MMRLILFTIATLTVLCEASVVRCEPSEVIIYYANETNLVGKQKENYSILINWLRSDPTNTKALKIAGQLEKDSRDFPEFVNKDIAAIGDAAIQRGAFNVVMFTNANAVKNQCLVYYAGFNKIKTEDFQYDPPVNYVAQSQPLSEASTLLAALKRTSQLFPSEKYKYILISKSHGTFDQVLTPRISVRHEETTREEILKIATFPLDADPGELPSWINKVGVNKDKFFEIIDKAGTVLGMQFTLIHVEACNSKISRSRKIKAPTNVSVIVTPSGKVGYNVLDYHLVLTDLTAGFAKDALLSALKMHYPNDIAISTFTRKSIFSLIMYYIPLFLLICGLVLYRLYKNRKKKA